MKKSPDRHSHSFSVSNSMMRVVRWTLPLLLLSSPLLARNPNDLSLTLATKDGHTIFRIGEDVQVELRFETPTPGRYQIWATDTSRTGRVARFDRFVAEPNRDAVDPLRDAPDDLTPLPAGGIGPSARPLRSDRVYLHLNEWISFRRPGQYRIWVETKRVEIAPPRSSGPQPRNYVAATPVPVPLRSNSIEIQIAVPEPGWTAKQLQQATATLERGEPRSVSDLGMVVDPPVAQWRSDLALAGRVLRFLETPDAAEALARFYENGPQRAQQDIHIGLFASPHRKQVIRAMEKAAADPEIPITSKFVHTLIELVNLNSKEPSPSYVTRLQKSLGNKQILNQLPAPSPNRPFTDDFSSLQPATQSALLTGYWPRIASPSLEASLQAIAQGPSNVRDIALLRLYDLDSNVAGKIAVERIRKLDVTDVAHQYSDPPRSLLLLPDTPIPELDEALVNALREQNYPVTFFVARYASGAVLERVRAIAQRQQRGFPCGPLLAYFFRVDPAWASQQLAEAREKRKGACPLYFQLTEDVATSRGLEQAGIDDLSSPDPTTQKAAEKLLQNVGSLSAKQALWDALPSLGGVVQNADRQMLEDSLVDALSKARGWVLTPEDLDRLVAGCVSETCRRKVNSVRTALKTPVSIVPIAREVGNYAEVGPFVSHSREQFAEKIAQFPRGTQFHFVGNYEGTWLWEQRTTQIRAMLDAAGMEQAAPGMLQSPLRIGGNMDSAKMIRKVPPIYPDEARATHTEGAVVLHVIVGTDGNIKKAELIRGNPLLVQAAINAVCQWQYQPTILNGNPVEVDTTITVDFRLN